MNNFKVLKQLGLTDNETLTYTSLLKSGALSATEIEKTSKLHRPLVYHALDMLIEKGLVRVSPKGKRKLYVPESPEKLEQINTDLQDAFITNMEDLYQLYEKGLANKPSVTYGEGRKAIEDSYMDLAQSLDKDELYYRYASVDKFTRDRFLPKGYRALRNKKGLERLIITSAGASKETKSLGASIKTVPVAYDLFEYNIGQVIYGDKVAIIDYDSQGVITVSHPKFAEFQKKVFKLLFSKL